MRITYEENRKLIETLENYPEKIRSLLFNVWNKSLEGFDIKNAQKLVEIYPTYPIISCVAGLDLTKISKDGDYHVIANNICYGYLKQFNPDLFLI